MKQKKLIAAAAFVGIITVLFFLFSPARGLSTLKLSGRYGKEMFLVLPAVLVMMGLADIWIPRELIKKHLGESSGFRGVLIAAALGTLPTGPMYIAFPIAGELLRKQARVSNVVIFLGVWASLKIPQLGVEIQFLGIEFTLIRFILTLAAVIGIGYATEFLAGREKRELAQNEN